MRSELVNTVCLTRVYRFNAGHRLFRPDRDHDWNRRTFGKCSYPEGHGHNYVLEVTVEGVTDPETGMAVSLEVIDDARHKDEQLAYLRALPEFEAIFEQ